MKKSIPIFRNQKIVLKSFLLFFLLVSSSSSISAQVTRSIMFVKSDVDNLHNLYVDPIGDADVTIQVGNQTQCVTQSDWVSLPNYYCPQNITNNTGQNQPLTIDCHQNTNITYGVSSFDIILIRKHILGIESIEYPWRQIAADVNLSGTISTSDIVGIYQVILGLESTFPAAESYEFVNRIYPTVFGLTWLNDFYADPFNMNSSATYPDYPDYLGATEVSINANGVFITTALDFYGIKMGDIDASNLNSLLPEEVEDRSSKMSLNIASEVINQDEEFELSLSIKDFSDIAAFQMALDFDTDYLELIDANISALPNLPDNLDMFAKNKLDQGQLNLLWFHPEAVNKVLSGEKELFTLKFKALKDIDDIEEVLKLDEDANLQNVFYANDGTERQVSLSAHSTKLRNQLSEAGHISYPNPFSDQLSINFEATQVEATQISLFDIHGKMIRSYEVISTKGFNNFTIENLGNLPLGIYNYRIQNTTIQYTGKMIKQ